MNSYFLKTLLIALLFAGGNIARAQRITVTVAGTGNTTPFADGSPGYNTNMADIVGDVCSDGAQNIYFTEGHRIRKIDNRTGIVATIAGNGTSEADDIPATNASIAPGQLCMDVMNNLYFGSGSRIRKINLNTGIITSVAGTLVSGYSGDGGQATLAQLSGSSNVCIDVANNLYITDAGNYCIRKVVASTGVITTIAGIGVSGYSGNGGLATAAMMAPNGPIRASNTGDVYFSDQIMGSYIRKISAATGIISLFAGTGTGIIASGDGGPATSASIGQISGIDIDSEGNMIIDDLSCACRKIDMTTGIINIVAGHLIGEGFDGDGHNSLFEKFVGPRGVHIKSDGTIYVADAGNRRIRKVIKLTNTPQFCYGNGQTINGCTGHAVNINKYVAAADLDSAQLETWTVLNAPVHGTLTGIPYTMLSGGKGFMAIPGGMSYMAAGSFSGSDSFKIKVSDGSLSDTITIYVSGTVPIYNSITGATKLCVGATTQFSTLIGGGTWTTTNATATVSGTGEFTSVLTGISGGTDTAYYTISGSCASSWSITDSINSLPDPGTITGVSTVVQGNNITLASTNPGGTWSSSNASIASVSSSDGTVHGISPGTSNITYTRNGVYCDGVAYITITVLNSTAVNNAETNSGNITIAPNPAKDNFSIKMSSPYSEPVSIVVTDLMGKQLTVLTGTTNATIKAALPGLAAGVYLLNIKTEHEQVTRKVVLGQ